MEEDTTMRFINYVIESELKFWSKIYDENAMHWTDKSPSNLTKATIKKYGPFKSVLEIGCAAGIDTFLLARHSDKIIGIDIVHAAIEIANTNLKKQLKKIKNRIKFEVGDAENLKYAEKSFDLVYSLSVLHSTDPSKSIPEVRRVLKDDGHFVVYVYVKPGKEGINEEVFINECKKYFKIEKMSKHEIKEDNGGDFHIALILFLGGK